MQSLALPWWKHASQVNYTSHHDHFELPGAATAQGAPARRNQAGFRVSSSFVAKESGPHIFLIMGYRAAQLWLSESPVAPHLGNVTSPLYSLIAFTQTGEGDDNKWDRSSNQRSVPQNLVADKRYYLYGYVSWTKVRSMSSINSKLTRLHATRQLQRVVVRPSQASL